MLDFHPITLADKPRADEILLNAANMGCEYCFGTLFIWRNIYKTQIAFHGSMLTAKYFTEDGVCYCCPVGEGDFAQMVESIILDAKKDGNRTVILGCSAEDRAKIESLFPNKFTFTADDSRFDYIYSAEKLATLSGKKLHGKRNHISAFVRNNPDWTFEEITAENIGQCAAMNEHWLMLNEYKDEVAISAEHNALNEAIANYAELGLWGGLIRAGGEIVAFSFGERLNGKIFCTHFEKAYATVQGAYPIINREMAVRLKDEYELINREEDTGAPGLRKAKQSYYPEIWLEKFSAECD
ncbi:MAG: DUF2156 domain-containing protein [Clostridia bacterium]|nr:DUF2156 domain-containing protein [Clostridia bacterium]